MYNECLFNTSQPHPHLTNSWNLVPNDTREKIQGKKHVPISSTVYLNLRFHGREARYSTTVLT